MNQNRRDPQHATDTAPSSGPQPSAQDEPVVEQDDTRRRAPRSAADQAVENQQRALESGEENPG